MLNLFVICEWVFPIFFVNIYVDWLFIKQFSVYLQIFSYYDVQVMNIVIVLLFSKCIVNSSAMNIVICINVNHYSFIKM